MFVFADRAPTERLTCKFTRAINMLLLRSKAFHDLVWRRVTDAGPCPINRWQRAAIGCFSRGLCKITVGATRGPRQLNRSTDETNKSKSLE